MLRSPTKNVEVVDHLSLAMSVFPITASETNCIKRGDTRMVDDGVCSDCIGGQRNMMAWPTWRYARVKICSIQFQECAA